MTASTLSTREKMIVSAALLLREHGVHGTSFAKVLEDSSTPRGSIAHHFPGGKREMIAEAVRWAGGTASTAIRRAIDRGDSPSQVFSMICGFYRRTLVDTDFAAGCPVGAVAAEAHEDQELSDAAREVFEDWRDLLAGVLMSAGRPPDDANALAETCICSVEGALTLARVDNSAAHLDRVEATLLTALDTQQRRRSGRPARAGPRAPTRASRPTAS